MLGIGATAVLFGTARYFARGTPPHTMTKEYQEASDEYLKVSLDITPPCAFLHLLFEADAISLHRKTRSSPSPVSLPRTTRVASWSKASPQTSKLCLDITRKKQKQKNNKEDANLPLYSKWLLAFPVAPPKILFERDPGAETPPGDWCRKQAEFLVLFFFLYSKSCTKINSALDSLIENQKDFLLSLEQSDAAALCLSRLSCTATL